MAVETLSLPAIEPQNLSAFHPDFVDCVKTGRAEGLARHLEERFAASSAARPAQELGVLACLAVEYGKADILAMLLEAGADPNARNADGIPALTLATMNCRFDLASILTDRGASLETDFSAASDGPIPMSAVAMSCAFGISESLQWLLAHGARHDSTDYNGRTPLMHAAMQAHGDCIRICLAHGADPDAQDDIDGFTPAMHAVRKGDPDAMLALCEHGFDEGVQSQLGFTAEDFAKEADNPAALIYLAWKASRSERLSLESATPEAPLRSPKSLSL